MNKINQAINDTTWTDKITLFALMILIPLAFSFYVNMQSMVEVYKVTSAATGKSINKLSVTIGDLKETVAALNIQVALINQTLGVHSKELDKCKKAIRGNNVRIEDNKERLITLKSTNQAEN